MGGALTEAFDADLARLRTLSAMQTKALRDDRRASLQSGQRTAARLAGELRELQKADGAATHPVAVCQIASPRCSCDLVPDTPPFYLYYRTWYCIAHRVSL